MTKGSSVGLTRLFRFSLTGFHAFLGIEDLKKSCRIFRICKVDRESCSAACSRSLRLTLSFKKAIPATDGDGD